MICSCSTWRKLDDTEKGAVIGGGTGAVVGDIVSPGVGGTIIGGAIGAVGGRMIGHESEDNRNRKK
jgi:outer membrane lipoprotein SlyB